MTGADTVSAHGPLREQAATLDAALTDPRLYANHNADLVSRATTRRAAITREVEALETEWLELTEKLEAA